MLCFIAAIDSMAYRGSNSSSSMPKRSWALSLISCVLCHFLDLLCPVPLLKYPHPTGRFWYPYTSATILDNQIWLLFLNKLTSVTMFHNYYQNKKCVRFFCWKQMVVVGRLYFTKLRSSSGVRMFWRFESIFVWVFFKLFSRKSVFLTFS